MLFGANPEAGMDWSDSALEANHRQMFSIIDAVDAALGMGDSPGPMDEWLKARLRANQGAWCQAMSGVSLREGVMVSHFEMLADWNWYRRRGGCDRTTVMEYLGHWVPMLAPATPHIAEEFWQRMGGGGLLTSHVLPELAESSQDAPALAREAYLRSLIDSARNLRDLAERHSEGEISHVVIQTAATWKSELARDALRLHSEDFDFKVDGQAHVQSLEVFENEALRGEIFQTWMTLTTGSKKKRGRVHSWSDGERALVSGDLDETAIIAANSDFISTALGVTSLEVYPVGEGEDVAGKASVAFPLEPGIAFL